ncbi:hypothetical protein J7M23_02980 [Candidatus Sumerlaeota bacterium]|nr:hypothetical protein [Candidatus Sumerlaeota bacterium]
MAVTLGNREKIVILSIIGIFVIAGLHLFIFSPKARMYSESKSEMEKAKQSYDQLRNISPVKLDSYIKETEKYEQLFHKILRTLKLDAPRIYLNPTAPENRAKIRDIRRAHIRELMRLQKESKVSLTFLGENGWDFPKQLPEDITKKRVNLWDIISKIADVQSIIEMSKDSPTVLEQKEVQYRDLMRQIGIDVDKLDKIKSFGTIVPHLKLMAHAELILKEKPQDYKITIDELYRLLRIEFDPGTAYMGNRQLAFLIDIINRAEKDNIDEVVSVHLFDPQTVSEVEKVEPGTKKKAPGAPPAVPPRFPPIEGFRGGEVPPEFMTEFGGMGFEGMAMPMAPTEVRKPIATLVPIQIRYKASNLNSSRFLYELTHCPATYEIDDLAIRSIAEANVEVITTINVTAQVVGVLVSLEGGST